MTQTLQQVVYDGDLNEQMSLFLNKGWKLVDVCIDTVAMAHGKNRILHEFKKKMVRDVLTECTSCSL